MKMMMMIKTYINLTQNDINDAANNNDKVKHIPRVSKITLWVREKCSIMGNVAN